MPQTTASPAPTRWPPQIVAIHWATVLLLIVGVGAVLWRNEIEARQWRVLLMNAHQWCGVGVVTLSCVRLAFRLFVRARPAPAGSRGARLAAAGVHVALYAGLLAVPLLGWWLSDARGLPWQPFALPPTEAPGADPDLADELEPLHAAAAWTLLALAGAHVAAALWHQFVRRDGLLRAMSWREPSLDDAVIPAPAPSTAPLPPPPHPRGS